MSEGKPGRGPDADSRTDTDDGQVPTNGRPVVPPVRYGPRNGSPSNGTNGRGGPPPRTVSGPSSAQQYRAPQPPPTPANGAGDPGTHAAGSNGSNGSGANGAHPATPSSYTRPRPNGSPARPDPTEQERLVADARIAAAARNASAAKSRDGSTLSGHQQAGAPEQKPRSATPDHDAPVDETAVIPAVSAEGTAVTAPVEPDAPAVAPTEETPAVPEKGRSVLDRFRGARDRRAPKDPEVTAPPNGTDSPALDVPADTDATARTDVPDTATEAKTDEPAEPASTTEPVVIAAEGQEPATEERPLTWRDRLGLPPKAPKPDPETTEAPSTETAVVPAAAAGAAAVAGASSAAPLQGRATPTPLVPGTAADTVIIPAVEAGTPGPTAPAAVAALQPVAPPKPKVGAARRTRKARLRLSRVDPWSVMKTALLFSIAAGIILVVATYGVWSVLNASGLFDAVNDMVKSVVSTPGDTTPFRIEEYVNTQKVIGVAALIAVVDVLIFTALATLGSFLYNLAATVLGGLEVTLAED